MRLNCWVQGDNRFSIFPVGISQDSNVGELRDEVKLKRAALFRNIDACDIILFKNNIPDDDDFLQHASAMNFDPTVALRPTQILRNISESGWPEEECVHIFVRRPSADVMEPLIHPTWSRREQTVKRLFKCLESQRLVQIRGTPASGKSTLMKLLHAHIKSCQPDAIVQIVMGWPEERLQEHPIARFRRFIPGYPFPIPQKTFILFDNAHLTYWDSELWEFFFKDQVMAGASYRVALFCGYGSPTSEPNFYPRGTPLILEPLSCISLSPRDDIGGEGIGLLLSQPEFDEYMAHFNAFPLDSSFLETLYAWTAGHAGAIESIWRIIESQRKGGLEAYTVNDFLNLNPWKDFFKNLGRTGFARGLPTRADLHDVNIAKFMRKLLQNFEVSIGKTREEKEVVQFCHRKGWIQSNVENEQVIYSFASNLHGVYVSLLFSPSTSNISYTSVTQLAFDAISQFRPFQLSAPARVRTLFTRRPVEAKYQDELYRALGELVGDNREVAGRSQLQKESEEEELIIVQQAPWQILHDILDELFVKEAITESRRSSFLHFACSFELKWLSMRKELTTGFVDGILQERAAPLRNLSNVRISPEFATAPTDKKGRVDIFLPTQRWGVELTREGDDLQGHYDRFGRLGMPKLIHAVFTVGFTYVDILDNNLEVLKKIALLETRL
ncbi:hypothetical protein BD410DRAFT_830314 [Rickenella mellea]|uniref:Crinkler effector protein N-terminal domain-containing protein n=1 Tax=Rickenella mellea TaxID=50990 RepID=A0A4Y7PVU4_9AGAM|nr:hypothetical protein BD410DRAFT_830314 [Rickenella mellea]